jgi:asparagine synthase (glutamine-hydrolysing)
MCGFSGQLRFDGQPVDRALVKRMTRRLLHRGPDAGAHHFGGGVGLGHRRLSIIDPEGGGQPMRSERGTHVLVANSEIYNYLEIREDLASAGYRFRTSSDTEVLLRSLEHEGAAALARLEGMFAFALWDEAKRTLLLARDPFGIKPLYYYADATSFIFASELKALLAYPALDRELDLQAVDEYFGTLALPEPRSVFRRVHKLPAGHYLTVKDGGITVKRYWNPPRAMRVGGTAIQADASAQDRLTAELHRTVQLTLRSDVPVGVLLSGGLDSSTIAALAALHSPRRVQTFSAAFAETQYDESDASRAVADHLATRHHRVVVTRDHGAEIAARLTRVIDEPFADSSAIPMAAVCELASAHVKTVLSGEGADELFAGYPWHVSPRCLPAGADPSRTIFPLRQRRSLYTRRWREEIQQQKQQSVNDVRPSASQSALQRTLLADINGYLPSDILFKSDRVSMAHSLELRVPYLNRGFAEFVMRLPDGFKLRDGVQKFLLKRSASRWLPPAIVKRRKQGFSIPMDLWLWQKGRWRDLVYDTLFSASTRECDQFDKAALERMQRQHDGLEQLHGHRLWTVFIFVAWQRHFMEGRS